MVPETDGLMAFWAEIEAPDLLRFQEWHNCEHIPERVGIPGFRLGRRFRGEDGASAFLMCYDTVDTSVLSSDAYLAALDNPTPWTRECLTYFRNPSRNIYRRRATAGGLGRFGAAYAVTLRFGLDGDEPLVLLERLEREVLPALADDPHAQRVRLFEIDRVISGIETSERQIYGGGAGEQPLLLFLEAAMRHGAGDEPWPALVRAGLDAAGVAPAMTAPILEVAWLEFQLAKDRD